MAVWNEDDIQPAIALVVLIVIIVSFLAGEGAEGGGDDNLSYLVPGLILD
ncbi:hypothetical protein [Paenibacillus turpanensis]|nr:hypothetical protein [Paenibacillus turpanensis]